MIGCEPRLLRQHCFQQQRKDARAEFEKRGEDEKLKLKHNRKTLKLVRAEKEAAILQEAIELKKDLLERAKNAVSMRKNVDAETLAKRVQVFETLAGGRNSTLKAGRSGCFVADRGRRPAPRRPTRCH